jgi:PHP family Zn ribbon phosphoesterase
VKLVPLLEIIAKATGSTVSNKKVHMTYALLCRELDSELAVLLKASLVDIAKFAGESVSAAVKKVRRGEIIIDPGYDGEYGKVVVPHEPSAQLTFNI